MENTRTEFRFLIFLRVKNMLIDVKKAGFKNFTKNFVTKGG